jgi:glycerophosphoryl diester phosphodiesterase
MKLILATGILILAYGCNTTKKVSSTASFTIDRQGHRGCRGLMPENTNPAMLKAIDLGVTTLEMDVVISKDRKVVVSHDNYFNDLITTTPQGTYLTKSEAPKHFLYSMTYDSISKYDVGLKPHPDFPRQLKIAVHKPLLTDLLQATEAYAKNKGVVIHYNIEIKSKPETDGIKHPAINDYVDLLMDVVGQKGVLDRTTIQSFDPRGLQIIHQKFPGVSTSLLIENNDRRTLDEQLQQLGFSPAVYSPHYSLVTPALVKACHDRNIKVIPWTVNTLDGIKKQLALGVDGIISDYPDLYSKL